jgi:ABC-type transporter Mla subunit MlaD
MSPPLVTGRRRVKQQLAGLLFLGVLAGVVALSIALYQKAFTPVVMVELKASSIGNQLSKGGDVKARGLLVGDIREVSTDGAGATIRMALKPQAAEQIPSDTRARLLPKTLFGEKFVSLEFDDDSSAEPAAGRATSSSGTAARWPARPSRPSTTSCRCSAPSSRSSSARR